MHTEKYHENAIKRNVLQTPSTYKFSNMRNPKPSSISDYKLVLWVFLRRRHVKIA